MRYIGYLVMPLIFSACRQEDTRPVILNVNGYNGDRIENCGKGNLDSRICRFLDNILNTYDSVIVGYSNDYWSRASGQFGYALTKRDDSIGMFLFRLRRIYSKNILVPESREQLGTSLEIFTATNSIDTSQFNSIYSDLTMNNFSPGNAISSHPNSLVVWVKLSGDPISKKCYSLKYFVIDDYYEESNSLKVFSMYSRGLIDKCQKKFIGSYEVEL